MSDITVVTAVTPSHEKRLYWCLPTWRMKKQFRGAPLIVFYHDMKLARLEWVKAAWRGPVTFVPWEMSWVTDDRERMLSAFVLGAAAFVQTSHCVKMDADCFFTDGQPVFDASDFEVDLCSHKWGYTKPAEWIRTLEKWAGGKATTRGAITGNAMGHKRIQSICCLHKTSFLKSVAALCGDRMPIPSHDTLCWWIAEHVKEFTWKRKNLKKLGVGHCSRWKRCRENVCGGESVWNATHYKLLCSHVQLEITTRCNLRCPNCDRNCGTALSPESMTLEQIRKFVNESLEAYKAGHKWDRIDVLGGEPTLHPELIPILNELNRYRAVVGCQVRLTTNGTGRDVLTALEKVPPWVKIRNSAAEKKRPEFDAVNVAPVDEGIKDAKACSIPWRCGVGLTRYGYHLCGAGAAIARVFGLDIGLKSIEDLQATELLRAQRDVLCRLCGHSSSAVKLTTKQETSKTWAAAFEKYKAEPPELRVY